MTRVLLAGVVAVMCSACPGVRAPLERPLLTVRDVAASSDPHDRARVLVRIELRIDNPNRATVRPRALDWQLSLAGQSPVRGRSSLESGVADRHSSTVLVRIELAADSARPATIPWHQGGGEYHLQGTLHLFSDRGDMGVVVDQRGRLAPW